MTAKIPLAPLQKHDIPVIPTAKSAKLKPLKMAKKNPGNSTPKMSKNDPDYYSKIAEIAGKKLLKRRGTEYFSNIAKLSHPRAQYNGGRPRKIQPEPAKIEHEQSNA